MQYSEYLIPSTAQVWFSVSQKLFVSVFDRVALYIILFRSANLSVNIILRGGQRSDVTYSVFGHVSRSIRKLS